MKYGSLVAGVAVVELWSSASSASRVAVLAVSEGVDVLAHLAEASVGGLQHAELLALPAVSS